MSANESLFVQTAEGFERLSGPLLISDEIIAAAQLCIQESGKPNDQCSNLLEAAVVTDMYASDIAKELHEAKYDDITGLLRRPYFMTNLEEDLQRFSKVGIIYFDLDNFKAVNDAYGHEVGDEALSLVGSVLKRETRDEDVIGAAEDDLAAHLAGDEFCVEVDPNNERAPANNELGRTRRDATDEEAYEIVNGVADRIRSALQQVIDSDERLKSVNLGVSVGVAVSTQEDTPATLLNRADLSMYQEKLNKR